MPAVRILADENIPLVAEFFGGLGKVTLLPGNRINQTLLRDYNVLLVRSVTRVDRDLLEKTAVRFVGSATIGTDHIDMEHLKERGIVFAHAPGSNAESVVEYVIAALTSLAARLSVPLREKKVGIIGCGSIGGRLAERLAALGCSILKNDPPLAEQFESRGELHEFLPLEEVLSEADIVSLHVPLVRGGRHETRHLLNDELLNTMRQGAWLLNTSRGDVVDGNALKSMMHRLGATVLDVWEGEPSPDPDLVDLVDLATPHIAGYSFDGKITGTRMLFEALCRHLGTDCEPLQMPVLDATISLAAPDPRLPEGDWLHEIVRQIYAIGEDDARLRDRRDCSWPEHFNTLRRDYPIRRRFPIHGIGESQVPSAYRIAARNGLRVRLFD